MPPDTEISTSTASNAWPHLKIGMQSSSQQKYKDAGKKSEQKRENERKTERERKDSKNWKQEQWSQNLEDLLLKKKKMEKRQTSVWKKPI